TRMAADIAGLKKISGNPCAHRPRNTHGIAEGTRSLSMNEHELFAAALGIDAPDERSPYLDQACRGDDALRARVEALLRAHEQAGSFLAAPPVAGSATLDAPKSLDGPGTVIGPYKLLQTIGEGGMGTVYMAEQTRPVKRMVALKVIKAGMDTRQV